MKSWFRRWHLNRGSQTALQPSQLSLIREHVPAFGRLSTDLKVRYQAAVESLINNRRWEGCDGLEVTLEMKTIVSAHAALMLLGTKSYCFESVNTILLFPGIVERRQQGRLSGNIGEAWANGGIVLSWPDVRSIGRFRQGHNVVIHEFAHHLDGLDGEMGGSIPFNDVKDQASWDEVSTRELQRLVRDVNERRPTLLDPYGATNHAEFFAVACECFFESPHEMRQEHPELFRLLIRFFHLDPSDWQVTAG